MSQIFRDLRRESQSDSGGFLRTLASEEKGIIAVSVRPGAVDTGASRVVSSCNARADVHPADASSRQGRRG